LYSWTSLGLPGNGTRCYSINSRGDVVGGIDGNSSYVRPYLNISDGNGGRTTIDLWNHFLSQGFFATYDSATQTEILGMEATAINDHGQIAGVVTVLPSGASGARSRNVFFYSPATEDSEGNLIPERFQIIPFTAHVGAYVTGINNFGVVVGAHHVQNRYVPFTWSEQAGLAFLGTFDPSTDVTPRSINLLGEICGGSETGVAWRYSPGTGYSSIYSGLSNALDINDLGQVVGTTRSRPSASRVGFREEPDGTLRTIKIPKTYDTVASAINSFGDVAGSSWDGTRYRPYIYTDATGGIDLFPVTTGVPAEVFSGTSNNNLSVTGMNDAGQICGYMLRIVNSTTGQRDYDGFVLTPIPVP
jgi:hypothetical protein